MKRPLNHTYLWGTLESLFSHCNQTEKDEIVVVIFLSDFEKDLRQTLAKSIVRKYGEEISSGLIQIIEAPREYYPSFENLKRTYGHPEIRVKWRAKQNIDYAYMMQYSQNISEYYLQLEDDVTTVPRYIEKIKNYIALTEFWVCLEFSTLGFIGKLYHSADLLKLSKFLTLFFSEQPNDVSFIQFNALLNQRFRLILKPTIFQHHGFYSTLESKTMRSKDEYFEDTSDSRQDEQGLQSPAEK